MGTGGKLFRAELTGLGTRSGSSIQLVSASSSFFLLILSLSPSASRLAACIFACIWSPLNSDMVKNQSLRTTSGDAESSSQKGFEMRFESGLEENDRPYYSFRSSWEAVGE